MYSKILYKILGQSNLATHPYRKKYPHENVPYFYKLTFNEEHGWQ